MARHNVYEFSGRAVSATCEPGVLVHCTELLR
jgi:hypothetical protein